MVEVHAPPFSSRQDPRSSLAGRHSPLGTVRDEYMWFWLGTAISKGHFVDGRREVALLDAPNEVIWTWLTVPLASIAGWLVAAVKAFRIAAAHVIRRLIGDLEGHVLLHVLGQNLPTDGRLPLDVLEVRLLLDKLIHELSRGRVRGGVQDVAPEKVDAEPPLEV
ncbi:hypothetical protein DFH06DRAFT_442802 [Mycena polygramma]|nr:hypothetical protein DFH06DRAFT_442802 [Mycena polygramma]